ncbi:MAG: hypothetical protein AAFX65_10605 [Cyanobacteria bacterium J06638_7]
MASGPYLLTLEKIANAYFGSGTFRLMLLNGYSEDRDSHEFLTAARASEIPDGNGYSTDGAVVVPVVSRDDAENRITVTIPEVIWTPATIAATHAVLYKDLGADGADELIFVNNFGGAISSTNDDFKFNESSFYWDFPNTD